MSSLERPSLELDIKAYTSEASAGINEMLGISPVYDQTKGNRCDLLTSAVLARLSKEHGVELSRELHQDGIGNWHYLLAHKIPDFEPTEEDLISDLNPWQWGGNGQGILHMPRSELMTYLTNQGAPAHFVALRSLATITKNHDTRSNPFA